MEDYEKMWSHHPGEFADITVESIFDECEGFLSGKRIYYGGEQTIHRKSCVFTDDITKARKHLPGYHDMLFYPWDRSPTTLKIRLRVEELRGHIFDYVLLHLYSNGKASIGYHNDKESLDGEIVSVSIGEPRRFLIRGIDQTSGFLEEYELGNGDYFVMEKGMQRLYVHSVPKQLKIVNPRWNWTFRNFPEW